MSDSPKSKSKQPRPQQIDDATRQAAWDELVRLLIRGSSQRQAAELLGFHVTTIQKWLRNPEFKLKLMRTRSLVFQRTQDAGDAAAAKAEVAIQDKIASYAKEAIDKIYNLMHTAEHERVQLKAATELADRSPETQKTKKVLIGGGIMMFTPENMAVALATAQEIRTNISMGKVIAAVPLEPAMAEPVIIEPAGMDDES